MLQRRFYDLPLGTRFRYIGYKEVWVVLERHGFGLIAKWQGVDGPTMGQQLCSLADTEEECKTLEVVIVED